MVQRKDPSQRARRNKDPFPLRVIHASRVTQPELPAFSLLVDGEVADLDWPEATVEWWAMWRDSPLATDFTANDWSFLRDTALLHASLHLGNLKAATELRLREVQFGPTPEARARLRLTVAHADVVEDERDRSRQRGTAARERRGPYSGAESADVG